MRQYAKLLCMKAFFSKILARSTLLPALGVIIVIGLAGFTELRYQSLQKTTSSKFREITQKLGQSETDITALKKQNTDLLEAFNVAQKKNISLEDAFASLKDTSAQIATTVGTLEKLSKTDRELLKKYSKVYFLNENYIPLDLTLIEPKYLFNVTSKLQFHTSAYPYLTQLLDTATQNNLKLQIISAYRSFGTQEALKSNYKVIYGAGTANQFSADQGYSEHQLGTTVDFTTPTVGASFAHFDEQAEYSWLAGNAYLFGFVLSYPKNNGYYVYEPWHWRFVGKALAKKLHDENKNFYDLDQREIDTYLAKIFD